MTNRESQSGEKSISYRTLLTLMLLALSLGLGYDKLVNNSSVDDSQDQNRSTQPVSNETTPTSTIIAPTPTSTIIAPTPTSRPPFSLDQLPNFFNPDSDETPLWGSVDSNNPLLDASSVFSLIRDIQNVLSKHPDKTNEILARQVWYADFINPAVFGSDRDIRIPELRGHGLTTIEIIHLLNIHGNYKNLFTQESWELAHSAATNSQNTHRERILNFSGNISDSQRNNPDTNTDISVTTKDGREAYFAVYNNAANTYPFLYLQITDAILKMYPELNQSTVSYVAERATNQILAQYGFLQGSGFELIDTDGDGAINDLRGYIGVPTLPYRQVCRVYREPVASNDPIDQKNYPTEQINIVPPYDDDPRTIGWNEYLADGYGTYMFVFTIDIDATVEDMGDSPAGENLANAIFENSTSQVWNASDFYTEIPTSWETDHDYNEDAAIFSFIVCGIPQQQPLVVIPTVAVTDQPNTPPENPPEEEPEKSPRGNQTNPNGQVEPDPTGGEVIIDGQIDTDGDGVGDVDDNVGSGR